VEGNLGGGFEKKLRERFTLARTTPLGRGPFRNKKTRRQVASEVEKVRKDLGKK